MVGVGLLLGAVFGAAATPVKQESFWESREITVAIIGVLGVILGVIISALVEWWREKRREDTERKRFAAGLLAEITALLDRYKEVVGDPLTQWEEGKPLDIGGSIRYTNFFAVYDGNTDKLGLFQSDHAQKIVRAYTLAKAHVESLAVFRDAIAGLEQQRAGFDALGRVTGVSLMSTAIAQAVKVGASKLRKESKDLLAAAADAKSVLGKY